MTKRERNKSRRHKISVQLFCLSLHFTRARYGMHRRISESLTMHSKISDNSFLYCVEAIAFFPNRTRQVFPLDLISTTKCSIRTKCVHGNERNWKKRVQWMLSSGSNKICKQCMSINLFQFIFIHLVFFSPFFVSFYCTNNEIDKIRFVVIITCIVAKCCAIHWNCLMNGLADERILLSGIFCLGTKRLHDFGF